ncbi:MAG TPA: sigma 54-interacting transcriptional regulator [Dissulfurispiraceae bacterium]|nr:sigma 54-interacting transcriptional regulator [Dissulfurispiraceae bacterium]
MTDSETPSDKMLSLRRIAEAVAHVRQAESTTAMSPEESHRLLHELQVHQIELEMQNEELRTIQAELEASRARYFELYDLAPVGYFTISEKCLILEANLSGAELLGVARHDAVNQPFSTYIFPEDQDIYYLRRKHLFETEEPQSFELRFLRTGTVPFWGRLDMALARKTGSKPECRAVLSDVTEHVQADCKIKHLALIHQFNPNPVMEFDFQGLPLYFNESTRKALEENGGTIGMFVPANLPDAVESVRQGAQPCSFHCEIAIHDHIYGAAVFVSKDLNACLVFAQDITILKKMQTELMTSNEAMEQQVLERTAELKKSNEQLAEEIIKYEETKIVLERFKEKLRLENVYLRQEVGRIHAHKEIIGNSEAIRVVFKQIEQVAPTDATVLIQGETGTGKELVAHSLHSMSTRKDMLMIKVNCAALPPTLIESELFGREKGAYTGSLSKQLGRFELADNSTIFLDEIDSLPDELQAKLLRVLESGEFERLGSPHTIKVNVRTIAATNCNLAEAVADGRFRADLYYRLNVFQIQIPPLRDRREDIAPLIWFFVKQFSERMGKRIESIPLKHIQSMQAYPWPGNVRELRNVVERAMIVTMGQSLSLDVPETSQREKDPAGTLHGMEKKHIIKVLDAAGWRISGKGGAAAILGINPKTLSSRMQKLGIERNMKNA